MRAVVLTFRGAAAAAAIVSLALLSACQSTAPTASVSAPPSAATVPPAQPPVTGAEPAPPILPPSAPLAAEARWLNDLFAGTPVKVAGERDGSVRLQVPMRFAFEGAAAPAASAPKPPLQAVLDKLSQSLKRQPSARLQAAAPGPASAERLAAIRSHLAGKGVANWRIAQAGAPADGQVLLRLVPAPAGLRQLDDNSLPPTSAGRPPAPAGGSSKASP